jgi:tetratricopeptide (TPR) repeat protein
VILPVTIRNYAVSKDFILITSNFGFNFYIGNNPNAPGEYETPKEIVLDSDLTGKLTAESQLGHSLKPSEVSRFWFSSAMDFVKDEPAAFLALFMKKALLFWNGYEIPQAENFYFSQRYSPLLRTPGLVFGVVAPFALLGLIISFKNWRKLYSLYIFIFSYMFSVVVFFVLSRFRIHVLPFLIVFAASGVYWAIKTIISKKLLRTRAILNLGLLALFFVLVNLEVQGFNTDKAMSEGYNMQGIYHTYFYKDYDAAIALFHRALEHVPEAVETYNNLATTYLNMEDFERAIEMYERLTEMEPDRWIFYYNLGIAYYLSGQFEEAIKTLETAVSLEPHSVHAARILERAKESMGKGKD